MCGCVVFLMCDYVCGCVVVDVCVGVGVWVGGVFDV